jgi:hypothetical protein
MLALFLCVLAARPFATIGINDDWSYFWTAKVQRRPVTLPITAGRNDARVAAILEFRKQDQTADLHDFPLR